MGDELDAKRTKKIPDLVLSFIIIQTTTLVSYLVRVQGAEPLKGLSHPGVLPDHRLNVGLLKDGLVVIDVPQLHHHPRVGHVVLVILIVLALVVDLNPEPEPLPLELVLKVQGLDHLERPGAVVVPHHGELVGTKPGALNNLEDI